MKVQFNDIVTGDFGNLSYAPRNHLVEDQTETSKEKRYRGLMNVFEIIGFFYSL